MRAIVVHALYGCETGCCGHAVEVYDDSGVSMPAGRPVRREFYFDHPGYHHATNTHQDHREFAEELRQQFAPEAELDWENCHVVAD